MADILKSQKLANDRRVIIERGRDCYIISAQQLATPYSYPREVRPDGWRDTSSEFSNTFEGAKRIFEQKVKYEERFLEMMHRLDYPPRMSRG